MAYTTIDDPSAYFQTTIYTGDGSTSHAITNGGNSDLQPDWLWIKSRSSTEQHFAFDSVRGQSKYIFPNANNVEGTAGTGILNSFNSDGFTLGNNDGVNADSETFVGWQWKKTADAGFDIVTATGTGSAKTIAHSLSAVPHIIISKEKTGSVNDWTIYHHKNTAAPETDSLILNETNATADQNTHWNDTAPTSSVFTVGSGSVTNRNNSTYVYYLFSEKQGYSKFGGYTGNGNADGAFIYTGFKPAWIMIKQSDGANGWNIYDNKRNTFNVMDKFILANTTAAEASYSVIDFLSNGIKLRNTASSFNTSAKAYVYFAFAESPLVTSTGVPTTAR